MFRGINVVNIDNKGRFALPARYHAQLANANSSKLIVTIDTEQRCLLLYSLSEWEVIEQKIMNLPSFNPVARRIQRLLIGHATEVELDNNTRILLPGLLREYAMLDKRIMVVGQGKKFEIWSEKQWQLEREEWLKQHSQAAAEFPPELSALSL